MRLNINNEFLFLHLDADLSIGYYFIYPLTDIGLIKCDRILPAPSYSSPLSIYSKYHNYFNDNSSTYFMI